VELKFTGKNGHPFPVFLCKKKPDCSSENAMLFNHRCWCPWHSFLLQGKSKPGPYCGR